MTSSYSVTSTIITLDREYDIEILDREYDVEILDREYDIEILDREYDIEILKREYDVEILKRVNGGYEDDDDNEVVTLYLKISVVYDKTTMTTYTYKGCQHNTCIDNSVH